MLIILTKLYNTAMSKRLTIAQAQQQLPNLLQELTDQPIVITQDGVPVMAAISYNHLTELLETLDILTDIEFVSKLRQSITQASEGKTVSWENAKAKLGL
ncbi:MULTISPECIES: type II toxin-antitoxin system Phd/YefM family antitoxin [unclassified Microcoleus]|uniref:type II toxin-antitoxin system Phd/YefM family antitoxin n=2 Tax=unclassified Microcoleus TaxID=2642155 RepID=UPI0025FB1875|nr:MULTISPECIES: type II toxin-antitoxin system Phd/YefM family antitoxin [unclassified Microcoleus]